MYFKSMGTVLLYDDRGRISSFPYRLISKNYLVINKPCKVVIRCIGKTQEKPPGGWLRPGVGKLQTREPQTGDIGRDSRELTRW